jgi:hypothetical protein
MSEKFKFSKAYPSPYLRVDDLEGNDATLTVKGWRYVDPEKDKGADGRPMKGTIITFDETPKELVLNVGNYRSVKMMYGGDTDEWIGKKVTFTPATTNLKGKTVPCIRVKSNSIYNQAK